MSYPDTALGCIEADLYAHGEVHISISEVDSEVEARLGTTDVDHDVGLLVIDDGTTTHTFSDDEIVHWYRPMSVFHD